MLRALGGGGRRELVLTGSLKFNFEAILKSPGSDVQSGVFSSFYIVKCLGPGREKGNLMTF